jgi:hypothetical protein
MTVEQMDIRDEANGRGNGRGVLGLLPSSAAPRMLGLGGAVLLGIVAGMRIGKRQGESVGLTKGLELGRLEAMSLLAEPPPRPWQRLWRRASTTAV